MAEMFLCTVILTQIALLLALLFDSIPFRTPVMIFLGGVGLGYAGDALHTITFEDGIPSLKAITLYICSIFLAGVIERLSHRMNEVEVWKKMVSEFEFNLAFERDMEERVAQQKATLQRLDAIRLDRQNRLQNLHR